jgi:PAS domain S-box-containing protein
MFGYNRRDIIGRNINVIVPEPLATVHQLYMLHYLSSGREVSFRFEGCERFAKSALEAQPVWCRRLS